MGETGFIDKKRDEFINFIINDKDFSGINCDERQKFSEQIIESFCNFEEEGTIDLGIINLTPGAGGKSVKFDNIQFDWKKLIILCCKNVITINEIHNSPWLIPLAGLIILNDIYKEMKIELTERHAIVIWVMMINFDKNTYIKEKTLKKLVNTELEKRNQNMSIDELKIILQDLYKIKSIEHKNNNQWRLKETVKVFI